MEIFQPVVDEPEVNNIICEEKIDFDLVEVDDEGEDNAAIGINDLPDELLENIFSRVSPYNDLDHLKVVCKRWTPIAQRAAAHLQSNFEQAILEGRLETVSHSAVVNELGNVVPPGSWTTERFGHMACYFNKCLYIVGGTTHTPTTFNDMWRFDLGSSKWSRCLPGGQYPTPKALASGVQYKDNFVMFGGTSPCPSMQPWKIFDELHIYNFTSNRWSLIQTSMQNPLPTAGHSSSVAGNKMLIFGGRTFNQIEQAYPLSDVAWVFNFDNKEWNEVRIEGQGPNSVKIKPQPRYGHTQVTIDDEHILVIGGCGGPNQVFADVWLLTSCPGRHFLKARWEKVKITNPQKFTANDFHYYGCKVGNSVVFLERSSSISPFLAFLQYDGQAHINAFEPSRQRFFHSRCSSGLRGGGSQSSASSTMSVYALDISKVLLNKTAQWIKEGSSAISQFKRPNERLLYSLVQGRAELILFGGFYKDPNSPRCRVSSDVFVLKQLHKIY